MTHSMIHTLAGYSLCYVMKSKVNWSRLQIAEQLVKIHSPGLLEADISLALYWIKDKIDCLIKMRLQPTTHPNDTFASSAEWSVIYVRSGLT